MIYLLSWINDHIQENLFDYSLPDLISTITNHVSEVEYYHSVKLDLDTFSLVLILEKNSSGVLVKSYEYNSIFMMPFREDVYEQGAYLITKKNDEFCWASLEDVSGEKKNLFPAFSCSMDDLNGSWKNNIQSNDILIKIDNKSIANRSDLLGHRGLAREIASKLQLTLIDESELIIQIPEEESDKNSHIKLSISTDHCSFYSAIALNSISQKESFLPISFRLAFMNTNSRNGIVDLCNYVLFDLGRPLHISDTESIFDNTLLVKQKEKNTMITTLDGTELEIQAGDVILSSKDHIIALSGIIGTKSAAVTPISNDIIIHMEALSAPYIRKISQKYDIKTESSLRFEKGMPKKLGIFAGLRLIKLLKDFNIIKLEEQDYLTLYKTGSEDEYISIDIKHDFIERTLGLTLDQEDILNRLKQLHFIVSEVDSLEGIVYKVVLPYWRIYDIYSPESIIKEIGRSIGYFNLVLKRPEVAVRSIVNKKKELEYKVKDYISNFIKANEVVSYGIFDELFVYKIGYNVHHSLELKNRYSEYQYRMIDTLSLNVMKAIYNQVQKKNEPTILFEIGHIFNSYALDKEKTTGSIIWYFNDKKEYDFFKFKNYIIDFLQYFKIPKLYWKKNYRRFNYYSDISSDIYYKNILIAHAGFVDPEIMIEKLELPGGMFIFEFDFDQLYSMTQNVNLDTHYDYFDISILIKKRMSSEQIETLIEKEFTNLKSFIIDSFEKEEWNDLRSITLRCNIINKDDIENIKDLNQKVIHYLNKQGIDVR